MKIDELKNKRILILGFGKEGRDSFRFLRKLFPKKVLGIADRNKSSICDKKNNIKCYFGKNYLKALNDYDVIVKSPGIPIHLPEIEKMFKQKKITSQTEIFFNNCPGKIIGITGTKGKGTTANLIYQILKKGLRVHPVKQFRQGRNSSGTKSSRGFNKVNLVGNIGKPALQSLFSAAPENIYVYELSSHQLYNLKKSPYVAVFLNIYPDHLDYFKNFKEYASAKANICKYQKRNDYLIYNFSDKIVGKIAGQCLSQKVKIGSKKNSGELIEFKKFPSLKTVDSLNIMAAILVARIFKISEKKISAALKNFKNSAHRLEYVGNYQGIQFYNDSAATIPEAVIFALNCMGDKVETLILGGSEKKLSFNNLVKRILSSKIKNLILFPPTGEKIWREMLKFSGKHFSDRLPKHFFVDNMSDAIKLAYKYTRKGKTCLLSPACASFGLFKDYKERGNLFKKYIRFYAKKKQSI